MRTLSKITWIISGMIYAFMVSVLIVSDPVERWILCIIQLASVIILFSILLVDVIKMRKDFEKEMAIWENFIKELKEKLEKENAQTD